MNSENTPKICAYTQKALNAVGATKEKIENLRVGRDEKEEHTEKLQKHLDFLRNANMEKQVYLHFQDETLHLPNKGIVDLRENAQKVYVLCLENSTKVKEIDTLLPTVKNKLEVNMETCAEDNENEKKKFANLSILYARLSTDRQKRQQDKEVLESSLRKGNEEINTELKTIEQEDQLYEVDDTGANTLETQNNEIQQQIVVYGEKINEIEQSLASLDDDELLLKKLHEEKMEILKKRSKDSEEEIINLQKQYDERIKQEVEYSEILKTLEEHNAQVKTETEKTAQFWEDLLTHSDNAFKKIEEEINVIKRDIEERNVKYSMMEEQKIITCEGLNKIEEFLAENPVHDLKSALEDAETKFGQLTTNLETSTTNYESLIVQNGDFATEITILKEQLQANRLEHADMQKKVEEIKTEKNLQLSELTNKCLIEEKCLEKEIQDLTVNKTKIEQQIQEMEAKLNESKQELDNVTTEKNKTVVEEYENKTKHDSLRKEFREVYVQKLELNKKSNALLDKKIPPKKVLKLPTIKEVENSKKVEKTLSDKFTRPVTPEPKKQKKEESNKREQKMFCWDSDSSQEETPKMSFKDLKRKQMQRRKF